jgi:hypothetical protein
MMMSNANARINNPEAITPKTAYLTNLVAGSDVFARTDPTADSNVSMSWEAQSGSVLLTPADYRLWLLDRLTRRVGGDHDCVVPVLHDGQGD